MKRKSIIGVLFGLLALCIMNSNVNAQSVDSQVNPRLYIITQSNSTCTMCTDNMTRWNSEVVSKYSTDPGVVFINYDMTDDASILKTRGDLDKYGIYDSMTGYNTPGSVIYVDPVTKKVVHSSSIDASSQDFWNSISTYSASPTPTK